MIESMTGFGEGRATTPAGMVRVRIRGTNHKGLSVRVQLPDAWWHLEGEVEHRVRKSVERGSVQARVDWEPSGGEGARVDRDAFRKLAGEFRRLARDADGIGPVDPVALAALPGVLRGREGGAGKREERGMGVALGKALAAFARMRRKEGGAIAKVLRERLRRVAVLARRIGRTNPARVRARRDRIARRVRDLAGDAALPPRELAREVAGIADRADVSEECERLDSHVAQGIGLLSGKEPVGRRLEFLIQEMHREANTIGSKVPDADVARLAVDLKVEVDRLREQVANVA